MSGTFEEILQELCSDSLSVRSRVVSELVEILSTASSEMKQQASAAGVIPPLVRSLQEEDDTLRLLAMTAIRHVKDIDKPLPQETESDETVAAIAAMLTSPQSMIRRLAAETMKLMARAERNKLIVAHAGAMEPLVRLLGDADSAVREPAVATLRNIAVPAENKALTRREQGGGHRTVRLLSDPNIIQPSASTRQ